MTGTAATDGRPDPTQIDPSTYLLERYQDARGQGVALRGYYAIKPLLPPRIRLGLRRLYARRQSRRKFPAWPIEPLLVEQNYEQLRKQLRASDAGRVRLVNYWPDRRRFAVVVTHDVESSRGIPNIGTLLELERRHNVVSSWNFVAEDYAIPDGTFEQVRAAGGEIGLHGITHDGKLFNDRRSFEAALPKIHRYLRDWNAVGFRSPATRRNAEWMADLGCLYDSSFPDTDPFEPQSGGCCSIFPYFFGDVVELPITLAQDYTLWEILRQRSIELWRQKIDWIVAHHGLINVIIHPDYVDSPGRLELYDQLLRYLRARLDADGGWHALPREVASWWRVRAGLRIEGNGEAADIQAEHDAPGYRERATVTWAHERDGVLAIDP